MLSSYFALIYKNYYKYSPYYLTIMLKFHETYNFILINICLIHKHKTIIKYKLLTIIKYIYTHRYHKMSYIPKNAK